jgi:hypothetical protein
MCLLIKQLMDGIPLSQSNVKITVPSAKGQEHNLEPQFRNAQIAEDSGVYKGSEMVFL